MHKEHLNEASFNADLPGMKPKNAKDSGKRCNGQTQVNNREHGEKIVHGLVETPFNDDSKQDNTVSQECNGVETTNRNGDPDMSKFQSRKGSKKKTGRGGGSVIEDEHGELKYTLKRKSNTVVCHQIFSAIPQALIDFLKLHNYILRLELPNLHNMN